MPPLLVIHLISRVISLFLVQCKVYISINALANFELVFKYVSCVICAKLERLCC